MAEQSTNRILLIEPAEFFSNLETAETNHYQINNSELSKDAILEKALDEFRGFKNTLVSNGIDITTLQGQIGCPDNIFPNWAATYEDRTMHLFSMLAKNRRKEKSKKHISFLEKTYQLTANLSEFEDQAIFLEGTSSMVLDRVNKIAYTGLSPRTNASLARLWGERSGYEIVFFQTESHVGQPIYHTDVIMYIGTEIAGISIDSIKQEDQERVREKLNLSHTILEITQDQIMDFCGNCLEVQDKDNQLILVMSTRAFNNYSDQQKKVLANHYQKIIHSSITHIEEYGGGSARCMMLELF